MELLTDALSGQKQVQSHSILGFWRSDFRIPSRDCVTLKANAPVVPQSCCNHEMKKICLLGVNECKASKTIAPAVPHSRGGKK